MQQRTTGKIQALEFEVGSAIQMLCDLGIAILNLKFIYKIGLVVPTS